MKRKIKSINIDVDEIFDVYHPIAFIYRINQELPRPYDIKSPARFIRVSQLMRALLRKIRVS